MSRILFAHSCFIESIASAASEDVAEVDGGNVDDESVLRSMLMKSLTIIGITSVPQPEVIDNSQQASPESQQSGSTVVDDLQSNNEVDGEHDNPDATGEKVEDDVIHLKEKVGDVVKQKASQRHRCRKPSHKKSMRRRIGKSDPYFIALFWLFVISRLWFHTWILQFVPILIFIYLAKTLFLWLRASEVVANRYNQMIGKCEQWIVKRRDAIVPVPVRGVYKLMLKGDKKVCYLSSFNMNFLQQH